MGRREFTLRFFYAPQFKPPGRPASLPSALTPAWPCGARGVAPRKRCGGSVVLRFGACYSPGPAARSPARRRCRRASRSYAPALFARVRPRPPPRPGRKLRAAFALRRYAALPAWVWGGARNRGDRPAALPPRRPREAPPPGAKPRVCVGGGEGCASLNAPARV